MIWDKLVECQDQIIKTETNPKYADVTVVESLEDIKITKPNKRMHVDTKIVLKLLSSDSFLVNARRIDVLAHQRKIVNKEAKNRSIRFTKWVLI